MCAIFRRHLGFFLVPGFTQCLEVGGAWVNEIWILELGKFCLWNPESAAKGLQDPTND